MKGCLGFIFLFNKRKIGKIVNWILNWIFIAVLQTHIILHYCISLSRQDQKKYFSALKVLDGWWTFSVIKLFHALNIMPYPYFASVWPLVKCFIFLLFTNREESIFFPHILLASLGSLVVWPVLNNSFARGMWCIYLHSSLHQLKQRRLDRTWTQISTVIWALCPVWQYNFYGCKDLEHVINFINN